MTTTLDGALDYNRNNSGLPAAAAASFEPPPPTPLERGIVATAELPLSLPLLQSCAVRVF